MLNRGGPGPKAQEQELQRKLAQQSKSKSKIPPKSGSRDRWPKNRRLYYGRGGWHYRTPNPVQHEDEGIPMDRFGSLGCRFNPCDLSREHLHAHFARHCCDLHPLRGTHASEGKGQGPRQGSRQGPTCRLPNTVEFRGFMCTCVLDER